MPIFIEKLRTKRILAKSIGDICRGRENYFFLVFRAHYRDPHHFALMCERA
jgi:hypothetical protein